MSLIPTCWLSMHAAYRCRHAGACCRAGWPIPLEGQRVAAISRAIDAGRIDVGDRWLLPIADGPVDAAGMIAVGAGGRCVFHQHDRCAIHGAAGHAALPSACQHFPRVCLIDARGVFVTLSHFCPTAASMLFDEGMVSIVDGPPALPDEAQPEGLDAREAWPPLLTERVLMDLDSYATWERHMVNVLAGEDREPSPESALARLRADASARQARLRVDEAGGAKAPPLPTVDKAPSPPSVVDRFNLVRKTVPAPLAWPGLPSDLDREWAMRVEPTWSSWAPVVQRFLAAHAFGSWLAYQGRGLQTIVSGLDAVHAVLEVEAVRTCQARDSVLDRAALHEAVRQTDLLLRHYVDRQAFADAITASLR